MKRVNVTALKEKDSWGRLKPINKSIARKLERFSKRFIEGTEKSFNSMRKEKRAFGGGNPEEPNSVDGFLVY